MKNVSVPIVALCSIVAASCYTHHEIDELLQEKVRYTYSLSRRYVWISNLDADEMSGIGKDYAFDGHAIGKNQGFWLLYDFSRSKVIKLVLTSMAIGSPEWIDEESVFIYNGNAGHVRDLWICNLDDLENWTTTIYSGDIKDYFYFPGYDVFVWYYIANDFKPESDSLELNTLGIRAVASNGKEIWDVYSPDRNIGYLIEGESQDGVTIARFNDLNGEIDRFEKKVH